MPRTFSARSGLCMWLARSWRVSTSRTFTSDIDRRSVCQQSRRSRRNPLNRHSRTEPVIAATSTAGPTRCAAAIADSARLRQLTCPSPPLQPLSRRHCIIAVLTCCCCPIDCLHASSPVRPSSATFPHTATFDTCGGVAATMSPSAQLVRPPRVVSNRVRW